MPDCFIRGRIRSFPLRTSAGHKLGRARQVRSSSGREKSKIRRNRNIPGDSANARLAVVSDCVRSRSDGGCSGSTRCSEQ